MDQRISILAAIAGVTLLASCQRAPLPTVTAQPTLTPLPTETPRPTDTPAPTFTPLPPTQTQPAPTFPAVLTVNGVDPRQVLTNNGFVYAGGPQVGSCSSSCAVYDNAKVKARVIVFPDGSLSSTTTLGADVSSQVDAMYSVVDAIYGGQVTDWIVNHSLAMIQGQPQDGTVNHFTIHMASAGAGVVTLSVAPAE